VEGGVGTVELKDLAQLQRAIAELGRQIEREIAVSCWRAAQWARGAATRATLARDAVATRTFVQAWLSKRLNDGAIVANSAEHSYFIERGRRAGKGPPIKAIEAWIRAKGIAPEVKPTRISGVTGDDHGGKQRARINAIRRERQSIAKSLAKHSGVYRMAIAISRLIARRGTRGRFILGKLLPRISARMMRDARMRLARLAQNPPRG